MPKIFICKQSKQPTSPLKVLNVASSFQLDNKFTKNCFSVVGMVIILVNDENG